MLASYWRTSNANNTAMMTKEKKRVAKSNRGCTPRQQLVHNWEVLTWPMPLGSTSTPTPPLPTRSLSSNMPTSLWEVPSFIHSTHKAPTKATPTMPKHTKSYHSTPNAMSVDCSCSTLTASQWLFMHNYSW